MKGLPRVGVPWSPKLVKVNAARPRGAGAEGAEFRLRAVVHGRVEVGGVGPQAAEPGVVGVDDLTATWRRCSWSAGRDHLLEPAVEVAEHDARIAHRLQRVP